MRLSSLKPRSVGVAAALSVGAWLPAAGALACETDDECAPGSACTPQTVEVCYGGGWSMGGSTGGTTGPVDAGAAEPGEPDMAVTDPALPSDMEPGDVVCETVEQSYCSQLPCESDADCGEGAVCDSWTYTDCMWPEPEDCDWESEDCGGYDMEPTDCVEHTVSQCVPRHEAPCEADADCGEGFDCVYGEIYECDGGSADTGGGSTGSTTGAWDGEDAGVDVMPEENCTSRVADEGYCQLRELPCEADAGCPAGMTCQEHYSWSGGPVCGGGGMPPGEAEPDPDMPRPDSNGSGDEDGGIEDCGSVETTVTLLCAPEYWGSDTPGGVVGGGTSGSGEGGTPDSNGGDDDAPTAPGDTGGSMGGNSTGDTGGGNTGSEGPSDEEAEGHHGHHGHHLSWLFGRAGGCSAQPGSPPDASWLALFGVLAGLGLSRRRSRTGN